MTVRKSYVAGHTFELSGAGYEPEGEFSSDGDTVEAPQFLRELLRGGALSSDAHLVRAANALHWDVQGDPTEGALVVAAAKAGWHKEQLDEQLPRTDEIPFSSESKRMTTFHRTSDGLVAYVKGAPEVLLGSCTAYLTEHGEAPLQEHELKRVIEVGRHMAENALRVLALAGEIHERHEVALGAERLGLESAHFAGRSGLLL